MLTNGSSEYVWFEMKRRFHGFVIYGQCAIVMYPIFRVIRMSDLISFHDVAVFEIWTFNSGGYVHVISKLRCA